MAPKKDKAKKDDKKEEKTGATFTEVEKTFLELQIADCNRKIARFRTTVEEYEIRNEELQKAYDKLDEDRADIIAYLKKTLNLKNEENSELKEKVKGLEETREIETAQFKETVTELERNFSIMKDQLTSENKLLAGKLNTLEEFRAIRDDLMKKFEKQEQAFKDQEMKYKRVIYDAEKKFVIGKDKLKKEMEGRLLQLAQDFQDATELRIAASTHRVIRENIAINNELDNILSSQVKLTEQGEKLKESERAARIAMELAEEERDKAINKNIVQLKVIDQLTTAFQEIKKEKALFDKKTFDFDELQTKIHKLTKENENLALEVRILEQNLHAKMSEQNKAAVEASKAAKESAKLKKILKEAAYAVKGALKLDQWATTDPTREIMDRQMLLSRLLDIVTQFREVERAESIETLASMGKIYEEGDLGFIPKLSAKKSAVPLTISFTSKESLKVNKRSSSSISISTSTLGSIKTIPSMDLIPASSQVELASKESIQSFITSTKSSETESAEEDESIGGMRDVEKLLAASKLEIQKSIMRDLAYSQTALKSQSKFIEVLEKSAPKSVVIMETLETEENQKDVKDDEDGDAGEKLTGAEVQSENSAGEDEQVTDTGSEEKLDQSEENKETTE